MNEKNIDISFLRNEGLKVIPVVQKDNGRKLIFHLRDYVIQSGTVARINALKPDGTRVYNNCRVVGNIIELQVTQQMIILLGLVRCQVEVIYGSNTITSFEFLLDVKERLRNDDAILSTSEFTVLEETISEALDVIDLATEETAKTKQATADAKTATTNANAASDQARTAATEANAARDGANTAKGRADVAATKANNAAGNAEMAVTNADVATTRANTAAAKAEGYVLGDISGKTVTYTQATDRANIEPGESTATMFGKIRKWFADFGAAAFRAVANNLTTTEDGSVLDARQGKLLADRTAELEKIMSQQAEGIFSLPNGLMIQWGISSGHTVPASGRLRVTVNYHTSFTAAAFPFAVARGNYPVFTTIVSNGTTTGFPVNLMNTEATQRTDRVLSWIAIGY